MAKSDLFTFGKRAGIHLTILIEAECAGPVLKKERLLIQVYKTEISCLLDHGRLDLNRVNLYISILFEYNRINSMATESKGTE